MTLHEMKMRAVLDALQKFKGNRQEAATYLGVHIKSIHNWIYEDDRFLGYRKPLLSQPEERN